MKNKKKKTCILPILIIILILILISVPFTPRKQIEYLDYYCEINLVGDGNFSIIIPCPINLNRDPIDEIYSPRIISGNPKIALIKTQYGNGLIINGTKNTSINIWLKYKKENVEFDKEIKIDLDLFNDKPINKFDNISDKDTGSIWIFANHSGSIKNITLDLHIDYWREYYNSHSVLDETIFKILPPHDDVVSYRYRVLTTINEGWNTYNITSEPIGFA